MVMASLQYKSKCVRCKINILLTKEEFKKENIERFDYHNDNINWYLWYCKDCTQCTNIQHKKEKEKITKCSNCWKTMPLSNENFKKQKQHEMKTTFNNRDKEYYLFICNECDHKIQKTQISKCNYCRTPLVLHDNKQWKEQLAHQKAFINEHTGNYYLFLCQNCINKNNILGGKIKNLSKISKIVEYSAVLLFIISLIISFLVFNYSSLIHWLSFGFGLILLVFFITN